MLKKIAVDELIPGMYIVDVTLSWSDLLSVERKMHIPDDKLINQLKSSGFQEIFVDTSKYRPTTKDSSTVNDIKDKIEISDDSSIELRQELEKAERIRSEALNLVISIMNDVKEGKTLIISEVNDTVEKMVDSILRNKHALVGLSKMQQKNKYIFEHAVNSCALMVAFANAYGFDGDKQQEYGVGAMLHDIGMMNISSQVLNKPGKLTSIEEAELRKHVDYGYNLLKETFDAPESALEMAYQHHEKYNGLGYPLGLKKEEISLVGRMISIIDVYDAATSDRGYKKSISPSAALVEILACCDKDFEGKLVHSFIQSVGIYPFGTLVKLKNKWVGLVIDVISSELLHPKIRVIYNPDKGGLIAPFDLELFNYKNDEDYTIVGVEAKEKLFLTNDDINKVLGVKVLAPF